VWTEAAEYVAIRDVKMCGCAAPFVHGLALPKRSFSGVEDPARPAALWTFAWTAARAAIPDEREIALVVNPRRTRGQDQLHVHLVRLRPDARGRLATVAAEVPSLEDVWASAARSAAAAGLEDYGILVARGDSGFFVVVRPGSPEDEFTVSRCG
jgi:CDP-diacylglycerol pyrophosphatase